MPRFVVLHHDFPAGHVRRPHWDLMLEWGQSLRTWAMASEPGSATEIAAEALPDHRVAYLDYEGPLSGDRGSVTRWDVGQYHLERDREDELTIQLLGGRLRGELRLRQDTEGHFWRVSFSAAPSTG
jgi:DNA polymerase ligase (LigD)-like protein